MFRFNIVKKGINVREIHFLTEKGVIIKEVNFIVPSAPSNQFDKMYKEVGFSAEKFYKTFSVPQANWRSEFWKIVESENFDFDKMLDRIKEIDLCANAGRLYETVIEKIESKEISCMKLLIQETYWWGWDKPGKKVKNYEYYIDNMKKDEKVIVSTTQVSHSGASEYVDEPNLYFILDSVRKDKVKLKIGSRMCFNRKDFTHKPLSFWIKEGQPLFLDFQSKDAGYTYSISITR